MVGDVLNLHVRLTPKAGRDAVTGVGQGPDGTHLAAKVRAIPDKGAANDALERLIAAWLGIAPGRVRLRAGSKSRIKTVAIEGDPEVIARLIEAGIEQMPTPP